MIGAPSCFPGGVCLDFTALGDEILFSGKHMSLYPLNRSGRNSKYGSNYTEAIASGSMLS